MLRKPMAEIASQLKQIAALQRRLLPRQTPQPEGWQLAVHYAVAAAPGGDYYDFLPFPDGRLFFLVGDATGHGGPAAVLMAMARVSLHSCPLSSGVDRVPFCPLHGLAVQPPHLVLGHLNAILTENSLPEQFMTAFCAVLNPADGCLHFASAGHPPPRHWSAAHGIVEPVRNIAGLPLGIRAAESYHHARLSLEPGDLLVCYSDGVTEARNDADELFGCDRLDKAIADAARGGATEVEATVLARLESFLREKKPQDDVTLLIVERLR
jgi:sigma-B regulation protein RsbU (phosphoserine phosphatase)